MISTKLMTDDCLGLRQCFADLDALVPSVIKLLGVTNTPAVSEPRTTATAATSFAGFPDIAAFGTHKTDGRRRDYWRVYGY